MEILSAEEGHSERTEFKAEGQRADHAPQGLIERVYLSIPLLVGFNLAFSWLLEVVGVDHAQQVDPLACSLGRKRIA